MDSNYSYGAQRIAILHGNLRQRSVLSARRSSGQVSLVVNRLVGLVVGNPEAIYLDE